ncbi:hypothetical protein AB4K20DRAFT_1900252, partial [Rhizopus microsporus]
MAEWCVDNAHKSCKSLIDSDRDAYYFTIAIKSKTTMKGVPVCFHVTDKEAITTLI